LLEIAENAAMDTMDISSEFISFLALARSDNLQIL
jgi:hypothetical protein